MFGHYRIEDHLKYEIDGEAGRSVFVIPKTNDIPDLKRVLCLSNTSLDIWNMIEKGLCFPDIITEMCLKYSKKESEIYDDVREFVEGLIRGDYITCM